jgi:hypothetical protein
VTQAIHKNGAKQDVEKVDEGAAHVDGKHEQQVHHAQKDGNAEPAVQDHLINFVRLGERYFAGSRGNVVHQAVGVAIATVGHGDINVFA